LTFPPESSCISYLKTPGVKLQSECKGNLYIKISELLTAAVVIPFMLCCAADSSARHLSVR
jgi:hypothetical protein